MPGFKKQKLGGGDHTWLQSTHGFQNAITAMLDVSTFTKATHFPDGYFPAGIPVNYANTLAVKPYTGAAGEKLGFVLGDVVTDGTTDVDAPVLIHGIVKTGKLPVDFTEPSPNNTGFQFTKGVI